MRREEKVGVLVGNLVDDVRLYFDAAWPGKYSDPGLNELRDIRILPVLSIDSSSSVLH